MKRTLLLTTLIVGACGGSAQFVTQNETGGTFALQGDHEKAMTDAQAKMSAHCGPVGYKIVGRERVVVGQESYSKSQTNYAETEERQTDRIAEGASHTDSEHGYDHAESGGSANSQYTDQNGNTHELESGDEMVQGGGYSETNQAHIEASSEDEVRNVQGGESTSNVNGVRDVTENQITYRCGA